MTMPNTSGPVPRCGVAGRPGHRGAAARQPRRLQTKVVHFGIGAFHRAHQAVYTEAAVARSGEPWGIAAVAPGSRARSTGSRAQDCLYSVTDLAAGATRHEVIGSTTEALLLRPDAARVDQLLRRTKSASVTLTVTEKGYHRRPDNGQLDTRPPRSPPTSPRSSDTSIAAGDLGTVVGRTAARWPAATGPAARRSAWCPATTWPATGQPWRASSAASCRRRAGPTRTPSWTGCPPPWPSRPPWWTGSCRPPPTRTGRQRPAALGVRDEMAVVGEPYRQWVLEDSFPGRDHHGNWTGRCSSPTWLRTS